MRPLETPLIIGASTRAAAFSALRAGLRPVCADLFADDDLRARCPVRRVEPGDYPRGFLDLPELKVPGPWLYTGGLENRPDLIEEIARRRQPLWGNPADVLRRARSPFGVRDALRAAGLPCPDLRGELEPPPPDGRWLVKPFTGAGGTGIRRWATPAPPRPRRPYYFQEFVDGESCAALFVGEGQSATLLGVTRQLVGEPWLHAAPFHYCGSVGPCPLGPGPRQLFLEVGEALVRGLGLVGLFGVDCVLRDGVPYPVEVNPRYTASVEVIEFATGMQSIALHRRAFDPAAPPPAAPAVGAAVVGKAIFFARAAALFPNDGPWHACIRAPGGADDMPAFADIPGPETPVAAGRPVLTLLCREPTPEGCFAELNRRASALDRELFGD
jgi:predicted ATP-grasp superfamily ATP-dependent carboligase